jgi:4-amino-4-deoxy-L-arabinose transferase-like glycosyltransferase
MSARVDLKSWQVRLGGILVVALAIRVIVVLTSPHFHTFNDSAQYDQYAIQLAHHGNFPQSAATFHGGPTAYRPPLFPGLLAILYKIVGTGSAHTRWEWARMLEAVLGVIVVLLVFAIAQRIFATRVALVAAAVTAVYPPLITANSSLLSESVFIPCVLASVWAALVYRDRRQLRWAVASGVLLGLSALTRGNGLELIIPIWFLVWVQRPRWSWAALKPLAALTAALVVTVTPWTIRNFAQFHQFVPLTTEAGYAVAGTYSTAAQNTHPYRDLWTTPLLQLYQAYKQNPNLNEEQASEQLTKDGLRYIGHHPLSLVTTFYWNTVRDLELTPSIEKYLAPFEGYPTWLAELSVYAFWVLALLCIAALWSRRGGSLSWRAAPPALWGIPLVVFLTTVPWLGVMRYRVPADPFLILPATLVLVAAWDRLAARTGPIAYSGAEQTH